jgi:hypothetical protein
MKRLAFAGWVLSLAACTTGSPTMTPSFTNVAGTWDVTFVVTGGHELPINSTFAGSMVLNVDSATDGIAGTLTLASGWTGLINGHEIGNQFSLTTHETAPCGSGTFDTPDGHAGTEFMTLTGTFDGRDCNGTLQTSFTAVRH